MIPAAEDRPLLALWPDAGEALGLKRSRTYAAADRGELPTVVIGRQRFVVTAELRRMVGLDAPQNDKFPEPASPGNACLSTPRRHNEGVRREGS